MDFQGQAVVANYLANMSKRGIKGPIEIELENEILKFFKKSLSNKVNHPAVIVLMTRTALSTLCVIQRSFTDCVIHSLRPICRLGKLLPRSWSFSVIGRKKEWIGSGWNMYSKD